MTEAAADLWQARWIRNYNGVMIFLDFRLLIVTLSQLFLVAVLFWYYCNQIPLLLVFCMKYYQYCNQAETILYQVYINRAYVPPTYKRVKNTTSSHDQ